MDYIFKDTSEIKECQVAQKVSGEMILRIVRRNSYSVATEKKLLVNISQWISPTIKVKILSMWMRFPVQKQGSFKAVVSEFEKNNHVDFMNKLESTIYNLVRKNPALKQFVRNMYQGIFDLLPRKKEYFRLSLSIPGRLLFLGFHDVTPFSFDETKLLANQNRLDLRMPLPSDGLDVGYFDLEQGPIKDFHRVDTSYAWNYHKGCRLQWLDKNRMIYNTAIANRLVSKIHDLSTGEYQVIDCPIDAVYHDGQRSLASSFSYEASGALYARVWLSLSGWREIG